MYFQCIHPVAFQCSFSVPHPVAFQCNSSVVSVYPSSSIVLEMKVHVV